MNTYGRKFVTAPDWYRGKRYRGRYALEYRVIAEKMIGRPLKNNEVVHHKDGNKQNNAEENLEVLQRKIHTSLHQHGRLSRLVEVQCPTCSRTFVKRWQFTHANPNRSKKTFCSRSCMGKYWNKEDRSSFVENKIVRVFFARFDPRLHNGSAQGLEPCGGGSIPSLGAS